MKELTLSFNIALKISQDNIKQKQQRKRPVIKSCSRPETPDASPQEQRTAPTWWFLTTMKFVMNFNSPEHSVVVW